MTRGLADLRPLDLIIQMAGLTNRSGKLRMRRDLFDMGGSPAPHDPGPVLNALSMAHMAVYAFMRALAPRLPRGRHDVAGAAKGGIIFYVVVESIAAKSYSNACQDQDGQKDVTKASQRELCLNRLKSICSEILRAPGAVFAPACSALYPRPASFRVPR